MARNIFQECVIGTPHCGHGGGLPDRKPKVYLNVSVPRASASPCPLEELCRGPGNCSSLRSVNGVAIIRNDEEYLDKCLLVDP